MITFLYKIKNKTLYYLLILITRPLLLYLVIMIIYLFLFIYFFADPVLCQADDAISVSQEGAKPLLEDSGLNQQDEKLNDLKYSIEHYNALGAKANKDSQRWFELLKEAICRPERHEDIEKYLQTKVVESNVDYFEYWRKASLAQRMVEELEKTKK